MKPILVLLQHTLRLKDNPALYYAAKTGHPILPVYLYDDHLIGEAQKWWLHESLQNLPFYFFDGSLENLLRKVKPASVYINDKTLNLDIEVKTFRSSYLVDPEKNFTKTGTYYKVFTQFWNNVLKDLIVEKPLPAPQFKMVKMDLPTYNLLPSWKHHFDEWWEPGEKGAWKKLKNFNVEDYDQTRNFPAIDGTSMLSPHLHFGEISPRQIWHEVYHKKGCRQFLTEIGWREFSKYLLYHYPQLPNKPFQKKFKDFQWNRSQKNLVTWQKGLTGYPIVDAGMRQLWNMGWMHNRVRMITGSFLVKDLLINWKKGEDWFWNTLLDADIASNSFNWQWVAGCGADAAPYFRIFNPTLQGEKFDPDGEYVKKWIPELKDVPKKWIHKPWLYTKSLDYPPPIVDHDVARKEVLKRMPTSKKRIR